jgi:pseudouridine synthase
VKDSSTWISTLDDHETDLMSAVGGVGASEEAISIKTAVLECWPEVNGLTAVHAIKRGEISYAYILSSCDDCVAFNNGRWVNNDTTQGTPDHDDNLVWHVERRHGKRLLHLNQHLAVTTEQKQQQHHADDQAGQGKEIPSTDQRCQSIWIRWKGDCRMVSHLPRFVAMHKPCGIITTMSQCEGENGASSKGPSNEDDDENDDDGSHDEGIAAAAASSALNARFEAAGISNVYDLLRQCLPNSQHLRAIGRLDKNTEGLLLFTTRGGWIRALSSPTPPHCPKRYRCTLQHAATTHDLIMWTRGRLQFRDRKCTNGLATAQAALEAVFVDLDDNNECHAHCVVDVTIVEGRYRQVRRCWEALGNRVLRLQRLSMGPIELSLQATTATSSTSSETAAVVDGDMKLPPAASFLLDIPIGECRELTPNQVAGLLPWVT